MKTMYGSGRMPWAGSGPKKGGSVMGDRKRFVLRVATLLMVVFVWAAGATAAEVPRMDKGQLREMLGNPDVVVIDVRVGDSWSDSKVKIKGAVRKEPKKAKKWAVGLDKKKTYILYCS
jgi:hypothetical protein